MIEVILKLRDELQCRRNEWLIFMTRTLETSIMVSIWKLGNLSLTVIVFVPRRTILATYLSFCWRVFCSYTWNFSTIILSFNLIPDHNGSFEGKSDTKSNLYVNTCIITIKLKMVIFNLPLTLRFKHCKLIVF